MLVFPIWASINGIVKLIAPIHLVSEITAICLQVLNIQFLLISAYMIKKLSNNKWVFWIYLVSSPVLIFTLFLEKYQICTFLVVLFSYLYCKNKNGRESILVLATGLMPTSIVIYIKDFFTKEKIKDKIKQIFKLAVIGLGVVVCLGRVHLLFPENLIEELSKMEDKYISDTITIKDSLTSYTNMIQGSFIATTTEIGKKYVLAKVMEEISIIGIIAFIILII